jgi:hypothetical protein
MSEGRERRDERRAQGGGERGLLRGAARRGEPGRSHRRSGTDVRAAELLCAQGASCGARQGGEGMAGVRQASSGGTRAAE